MAQLQTRKTDFSATRIVEDSTSTELAAGDIVVAIERFAFTANNITYAVAGDMIGYWQFFPPVGGDVDDWGVIPVWGFATVVASNAEGIPVGDRLFGYFPPADQLVMTPTDVTEARFIDAAKHRSALPAGYNLYRRVSAEAGYDGSLDNERMLLWPLFITSFCLWDAMQLNDWYGAEQVIVISASSKTSIGLAYALHDDEDAPAVVGLTSARNQPLVESLGLYDSTLTYEALQSIDTTLPTVIVDMSGNSEVLAALHRSLGDNMRFCINVGITHWESAGENEGINAERSEFFFAPAHIQRRVSDWGAQGFDQKTSAFIASSVGRCRSWLKLKTLTGLEGLEGIYPEVCAGQVSPDEGIIIEM